MHDIYYCINLLLEKTKTKLSRIPLNIASIHTYTRNGQRMFAGFAAKPRGAPPADLDRDS